MVRCWWVRLMGLLAVVSMIAAVPAASRTPAVPRIVAVGDLHGDFAAWRDIASVAGLIDASGRWAGGATTLVQLGDIADRGPDTLKIIKELKRLQREAPRKGGRVIVLVGNHEAMNITGDLRYVTAGEYAAFATAKSADLREKVFRANRLAIEAAYRKADESMTSETIKQAWFDATPLGALEHQAAWSPEGEVGKWVIGNPAVLLLDGIIFVHAGLSASYANQSIELLNGAVATALAAREIAETSIINDPLGPLWYRGFAGVKGRQEGSSVADAPASMPVEAELEKVLAAYGAQRMVIAHTPSLSGIKLLHGDRLVMIDTGISAAYRGQPSYLEIIDGKLHPKAVTRSAELPKAEK